MDQYIPTFSNILIDSGAYSVFNSGQSICPVQYSDWCERFKGRADAIAGLDDISGDWRKSIQNYKHGGFPTFHNTDPPELLDELLEMSREGDRWIGIGVGGKQEGRENFLRDTLHKIPGNIHVHGWALRKYRRRFRLDSVDSTNWWRDALDYRLKLPWLSYAECLEIIIKREQREIIEPIPKKTDLQGKLFS